MVLKDANEELGNVRVLIDWGLSGHVRNVSFNLVEDRHRQG